MEIYRLYVRYTKECKPGCNYEIYCLRQDENWSKETYYVGPEGLKLARKNFDLIKDDTYAVIISIEECVIEDNEIKPAKTIEYFSNWYNRVFL